MKRDFPTFLYGYVLLLILYISTGQLVIQPGDEVKYMYFILAGSCEAFSYAKSTTNMPYHTGIRQPAGYEAVAVARLERGSLFGAVIDTEEDGRSSQHSLTHSHPPTPLSVSLSVSLSVCLSLSS